MHQDPIAQAIEATQAPVEASQPESAGSFITILAPEAKKPIPWQYTDPDTGKTADTVFYLRQIPDETNKVFRKRHTTNEWKNGVQRTTTDGDAYGDDLIDFAIVDWDGLYALDADGERVKVPCDRKYKVNLPEKVKGEIIRLCLGKELAQAVSGK